MFWKKAVLALIPLVLASATVYGYIVYELNRPAGSGSKKEIIIESGQTVREIASELEENGLIRSANLFITYVTLKGLAPELEAGRYEIPPSLSMLQVVELLRQGSFDIRLTFLEGWRREEYSEYALQQLPVDTEEFNKSFLAETSGVEGYLFPDTYLVAQDISAESLITILRDNFEEKYAEVAEAIAARDLTREETVILASLVEREAQKPEERAVIAGIFLKRLELGMPLGVCATVQYALGYQEEEGTWWKGTITSEDTEVESPYNTYKNTGLPPGPICNPGLNALKAAANPQTSEYLYYLHDEEGNIHYARTLEEHNQNVTHYLR
jgi:UPF0755 protein